MEKTVATRTSRNRLRESKDGVSEHKDPMDSGNVKKRASTSEVFEFLFTVASANSASQYSCPISGVSDFLISRN